MMVVRHLAILRSLMLLALILACTASSGDEGSAMAIDYSDYSNYNLEVQILAITPTEIVLYWVQPDSTVSYYQVSYNVTVHYQTTAGKRIFHESNTTGQLSDSTYYHFIPVYTTNSTYVIRVTAVTENEEINSLDYRIPGDGSGAYRGRDDAITFFQLGLELTEPQASLDCTSFEKNYDNTLSLIRSQLTQPLQDICNNHSFRNDSNTCATHLASDQFSCHNNSGLVYVARVVGTDETNATMFLRYLSMLDSFQIALRNHTFSSISSSSCSLSIPSAEESNCDLPSVSIDDNIITNNTNSTNNSTDDSTNDSLDTTVFQLGLELKNSQYIDCSQYESMDDHILLLIRLQVTEAIQEVCNKYLHHHDDYTCATQLVGDHFSCLNNNRLVYVAKVLGTTSTSSTTFLGYLKMLGSIEISLYGQTFSTISSPLCPLSIPSAEESSCTLSPVTTTNDPTVSSNDDNNDETVVVIVSMACLIGIAIVTLCIICIIIMCSRCYHYRYHKNSVNVIEKGDVFTIKPYSLITNSLNSRSTHLDEQHIEWNLPAQSLILPKKTFHKDCLPPVNQYCHDRSTIEHHITTDH